MASDFCEDDEISIEEVYKNYTDADISVKQELILYPVERLLQLSGIFTGGSVIHINFNPSISHLFMICDSFKDITLMNFSAKFTAELEKWRQKKPDAINYSHIMQKVCDLTGNREGPQELEEKLRKKIKCVLHCDLTKENFTAPHVIPQADYLLLVFGLGTISKDQATLKNNIRRLVSLLKVGGYFVMFGSFNTSYFKVSEKEFSTLTYDENTMRTALSAAGCSIINFHVSRSKIPVPIMDNTHIFSALAVKEREI